MVSHSEGCVSRMVTLSTAIRPFSQYSFCEGWIAPDPLSVVPAMLLGLPWSYVLTGLAKSQSPALNLFPVMVSLAINGCLIWLVGHVLRRR